MKRTSLFLFLTAAGASIQAAPVNVLFVAVDDLRPELGCYGYAHMVTPNIDRLAENGLLFEQAYCQQAICAPSRISIMTGLRPDTTKVYTLEQPLDEELPDTLTVVQHFHTSGYKTIGLGKIYHHTNDDHEFWDVLDRCSAPTYASNENLELVERLTTEANERKIKKNSKEYRHYIAGPPYESADVPDNIYGDGLMADRAIEEIRDLDERPFFLAVGFKKPHLAFVAPKKYWDLYDASRIEIPSKEMPAGAPEEAFTSWGELRNYHGVPQQGDVSDELARNLIHGYRASVSYIDAQLGRILDELEQKDLLKNTLIVLWGDHGWKLGDYGDWCKHTNFELDTHVPLIYSGPGVPRGKRSKALVEYVDIFPTLADGCGLPVPEVEGISSLPLFENPDRSWKKAAFSQYPRNGGMGYTLRSGTWRYTEWRNRAGAVTARELYNHAGSDIATVNLADHPEYSEILARMEALMRAGPAGSLPES